MKHIQNESFKRETSNNSSNTGGKPGGLVSIDIKSKEEASPGRQIQEVEQLFDRSPMMENTSVQVKKLENKKKWKEVMEFM